MTANRADHDQHAPRPLVQAAADVGERVARGDLMMRRIFDASTAPFESSLAWVLYSRVPASGKNERHVHEDVEKVYYFLKGSGEVDCGPWKKPVKTGDLLFFPAAIEHEIRNHGPEDLELVVCVARTLVEPRGLRDKEEERRRALRGACVP